MDNDTTTETQELARTGADPSSTIAAFSSQNSFLAAQRMAKALAASSLVPEAYRGNLPNVLVAMELASRIGASVFAVMQNTDVIHGRPSMRSQFLIATANASGRFTPIRYRWEGKPGTDAWGCRAWAKDRESDEECVGSLITIGLAKAEGWYNKKGSKWQTMPEQMMMYRAAAFWTRIYAPELSLGMHTAEEVVETVGYDVTHTPAAPAGSTTELEASLLGKAPEAETPINPETGEALDEPPPAASDDPDDVARDAMKGGA